MKVITAAAAYVDFIVGMNIWKKILTSLSPSIRAASIISTGKDLADFWHSQRTAWISDIDRELRERRRLRRLRRQKRERRKKLMILGATGIITLVVVAGAVNGIAGFIRHGSTQSASSCTPCSYIHFFHEVLFHKERHLRSA